MSERTRILVKADFERGARGESGPYFIESEKISFTVYDKSFSGRKYEIYPEKYPNRNACLDYTLKDIFPAGKNLEFIAHDKLSIVAMMMALGSYSALEEKHNKRNVNNLLDNMQVGRLARYLLKASLKHPDNALMNLTLGACGLREKKQALLNEQQQRIRVDYNQIAILDRGTSPFHNVGKNRNAVWFYFDTEFNDETAGAYNIDLISVGLTDDLDMMYYAESTDMNQTAAESHQWLKDNVLPKLAGDAGKSLQEIREDIQFKLSSRAKTYRSQTGKTPKAVFCARNGATDYFLLTALFGGEQAFHETLDSIGFESVEYRDFYEFRDRMADDYETPEQKKGLHNALADARHLKACVNDMKHRLSL